MLTIAEASAGQRLDRALALAAEEVGLTLSRSRLVALIDEGAVSGDNVSAKRKVKVGERFTLTPPAPVDPEPMPEDIPLDIAFEDADLIVVNKPATMVVHPSAGWESGTLVNALLHHCGDGLTGIGGARRPGIVHRIDRQTSGLLVVAKTETAHAGLSEQFADHSIDRRYLALCWSRPDRAESRLQELDHVTFEDGGWIRIETQLGRHPQDRKKQAVLAKEGRHAITRVRAVESFGPAQKPFASLIECRLETGRTHQIRVHAMHIGHALIGDPTYGRPRIPAQKESNQALRAALAGFERQALHAETLGFDHPVSGETMTFSAELPQDMHGLLKLLRRNG